VCLSGSDLLAYREDAREWGSDGALDSSGPHTVSITPDALGFPSTRIGLPSMYLETFLSRCSSVLLYASAAASRGHKSGFSRIQDKAMHTFRKAQLKDLEAFTRVCVSY